MDPKHTPTLKDNLAPDNQSDTRKLAIFQNDSDFYVIHKKAEKVAVATYMISNFFAAEEPLKWSLRKVAGELLKDTIGLSSASLSVKDGLVRTISARLIELISFYEVSHRAGFIGDMNFSIIKSELNKLLELLDRREGSQVGTKSIAFDESFFRVEKPQGDLNFVGHESVGMKRNIVTEHHSLSGYSQAHHSGSQSVDNKKFEIRNSAKPTESFIKDNNILKDIKDKRQNIIIALVKKHRTLTIKGFTSVIKDCSEKTIQRELLTLVSKGILKKEGERRWSTYSLG